MASRSNRADVAPQRRRAAEMVNRRRRHEPRLPSAVRRATAEVRLLEEAPEVVVEEEPRVGHDLAAEKHHRPLCRRDAARLQSRRRRRLAAVEVALDAKRRHDHATVVQTVVQGRHVHRPLHDTDLRMPLQEIDQRREGVLMHHRVVVEKQHEIACTRLQSDVVASRKAEVPHCRHVTCVRVGRHKRARRGLVRIVHHDDLGPRTIDMRQGRKAHPQEVIALPRNDEDGKPFNPFAHVHPARMPPTAPHIASPAVCSRRWSAAPLNWKRRSVSTKSDLPMRRGRAKKSKPPRSSILRM